MVPAKFLTVEPLFGDVMVDNQKWLSVFVFLSLKSFFFPSLTQEGLVNCLEFQAFSCPGGNRDFFSSLPHYYLLSSFDTPSVRSSMHPDISWANLPFYDLILAHSISR